MSIQNVTCTEISTIKDFQTKIGGRKDNNGEYNKTDKNEVSCHQTGNYSELVDKYKKHYSLYPEIMVAQAMCKCCKEKQKNNHIMTWEEFYECMKQQGITRS